MIARQTWKFGGGVGGGGGGWGCKGVRLTPNLVKYFSFKPAGVERRKKNQGRGERAVNYYYGEPGKGPLPRLREGEQSVTKSVREGRPHATGKNSTPQRGGKKKLRQRNEPMR